MCRKDANGAHRVWFVFLSFVLLLMGPAVAHVSWSFCCSFGCFVLHLFEQNNDSNSDIWRSFPKLIQWIQSYIYLTNAQGCETTVAAATCRSRDIGDSIYLQPYPLQLGPWDTMSTNRPAFPPLEMLGPFVGGARRTTPRLPNPDRSDQAAAALWQACHELTKADWKSPPASSS